jgi:hypothetical protein
MSYQAIAAATPGVAEPTGSVLDPSDEGELERMIDSGRLSEVEESALEAFYNSGGRPEHLGFGGV